MDTRIVVPTSKGDTYDVSDPTDWLGTPLAKLMQVEQSLRCHVCKDFFNSPMITSCCHTFCSLCIRRALNTDGKCPLCRATDQESKLRGNWAIREAADTFVQSRSVMLDLARRPATVGPDATPKRKAHEAPMSDEAASKRTRRSTRSSSARATVTTAASIEEEVDEPVVEEEAEYIPDDGLAACPICLWRMKPEKVDRHLDTDCPGEPRPQPNTSRPKNVAFATTLPSKAAPVMSFERIASMNYSILNETKLRKKLSDAGIPNWGARLLMEKRHREWVMIWNANCDSAHPKTKWQLLQDLDTWERTQGGNAPTTSASANMSAQIKDKDFDAAGWSAKHSDSFSDLIAQARKSQKKVDTKPQDARPSSEDAKVSETEHVSDTDHEQPPDVTTTKAPRREDPSARSSAVVDLTSPVKPREYRENIPLSEEHSTTEVDTLVSPVFAGTRM